MVLDVKFVDWAAAQQLDTNKLKAARVPIYGKWYFPTIPADVQLVNLNSGELRAFTQPMLAGEVLWAPVADLERAGFWPPKSAEELAAAKAAAAAAKPAVPARTAGAAPAAPARPAAAAP